MPKKRHSKKTSCSTVGGNMIRMKTTRGVRCVCAFTAPDGTFRTMFQSNDSCPTMGTAITYKQARTKYGE